MPKHYFILNEECFNDIPTKPTMAEAEMEAEKRAACEGDSFIVCKVITGFAPPKEANRFLPDDTWK